MRGCWRTTQRLLGGVVAIVALLGCSGAEDARPVTFAPGLTITDAVARASETVRAEVGGGYSLINVSILGVTQPVNGQDALVGGLLSPQGTSPQWVVELADLAHPEEQDGQKGYPLQMVLVTPTSGTRLPEGLLRFQTPIPPLDLGLLANMAKAVSTAKAAKPPGSRLTGVGLEHDGARPVWVVKAYRSDGADEDTVPSVLVDATGTTVVHQ